MYIKVLCLLIRDKLVCFHFSGDYDIIINGNIVGSYAGSGSFGELALMYNTPRAATIIAKTDGVLWALDRTTFQHIVLRQAFLKRQLYENLLSSVPLLGSLSAYERTNLADALGSHTYEDGTCIIQEGEPGEEMYFIEEGCVVISTKNSVRNIFIICLFCLSILIICPLCDITELSFL